MESFPRGKLREASSYKVPQGVRGRPVLELGVGNPPAVQWLGLCASTAGGRRSIPGWGTKIPQAVPHGVARKKKKKN